MASFFRWLLLYVLFAAPLHMEGQAQLCSLADTMPFALFGASSMPQEPWSPILPFQEESVEEPAPLPMFAIQPQSCVYQPPPVVFDFVSAVNRALEANRQLANNFDAIQKAEINLEIFESDFGWRLHPNGDLGYVGGGDAGTGLSVGGGIDFSRRFPYGTRFLLRPYINKVAHKWISNVRTTITQPLLRGFDREYTMAGVLGAQFVTRTAYRNLYIAKIRLILKTASALYEIVRQEELHRLNTESYERLLGFRDAAKLKEKIGLADSLDVYRAEIELRHAEDGLQSSEEQLQDAYDVLRDILALPMDLNIAVSVPLTFRESVFKLEDAVATALNNRIEIDQGIDQLKDTQRQTRIARQNLLPELNLVLDYHNCGNDPYFIRSCTNRRENTWGIGFTTSNDYNCVTQASLLEQNLLVEDEASRSLDQLYTTITLETKRSFRSLRRASKRIKLQEEQIKSSEGELFLSQVKFNRGLANNFDVIQAERNLRQARSGLMSAVIDHILGEYQLLANMGMLADKPCFTY